MKLRLFHRNKPAGIQVPAVCDTLSRVSVACIELTPEGELTDINMQAYKVLRLGGGDFSHPLRISDLFSVCQYQNDLLPAIFEGLQQHRDCGDLPPRTYIRLRRHQLKFHIEGRFVGQYDRHRKLRRVVFLFRDTEEEISRKFILDTALSQTKIFPWFFDPDSNLLTIDRRWFAYLGLPNDGDTISAETFFSLVHPDDRKALSQAFANRLAGEPAPDTVTYRLRRGDGTWEWFEEQSVSPGRAADGLPYRIAGICQSIQAHKEVEGRLREARDKARENDRLKSAFLANMSHEIRTPLNAIIGFANLVTCDDVPFSETERQEYSRLISANGDQLLRLISDILDLSKIESNTMEFCFGDQSLHTLLSDIYQSQLLTMPPQVELRLELPQADTTIRTDASRLKQVINNLINNAAKFTDRGSITFGYRTDEGAGEVELFVRDTGKGISQEHVGRIFERFYKTDSNAKGVGLGLSICRTIIEILCADLAVVSAPVKGTCFKIVHPVRRTETAAETAGAYR